jgi:hypothetical protein
LKAAAKSKLYSKEYKDLITEKSEKRAANSIESAMQK